MFSIHASPGRFPELFDEVIRVTSADPSGKADVISRLPILESNRQPNALNSALYALEINEDVGCGRALSRVAGVAVPAGRSHAALAQIFAWFGLVPLLWAVLVLPLLIIPVHCGAHFCFRMFAGCSGTWATATGFAT